MAWMAAATLLVCAAAILLSGSRLVRHADRLAAWTPLGRTRVGVLLLAVATSIPEIVSSVTAVRIGEPELASGNLLGTLPFNLAALGAVALALRSHDFLSGARHRQAFLLAVTAAAMAAAGGLVLLGDRVPTLGGVGLGMPLLAAGYAVVALRPSRHPREPSTATRRDVLRTAAWMLAHAAVVAVAAMLLPRQAETLSQATGLHEGFLGAAVLASATTLPELTVAFEAVRIKAHDLALGNALGSVLFNLALLGLLDVGTPGSLVAQASAAEAVLPAGALLMLAAVAAPRLGERTRAAALLLLHAATLLALLALLDLL